MCQIAAEGSPWAASTQQIPTNYPGDFTITNTHQENHHGLVIGTELCENGRKRRHRLVRLFIVIQLLVASGIMPVTMLWGGRQTELTLSLRLTSIAATVILGTFIFIIRYRAGLVATPIPSWIRIGAWIVAAFMALNTVGNFTSLSNTERFLFGPLALIMTISCLFVTLSDMNGDF